MQLKSQTTGAIEDNRVDGHGPYASHNAHCTEQILNDDKESSHDDQESDEENDDEDDTEEDSRPRRVC